MFDFIRQYLRHPVSVGAVAPSGKGLTMKMMEPIDFAKASCIVEYGPGTGSFTAELCSRRRPETPLILIEQNDAFYQAVVERFRGEKNMVIIHGTAEKADRYLAKLGFDQVDYVVSGLPFMSLPKPVSVRIFHATNRLIGKNGKFITFQYSLVKEKFFQKYFVLERKLHEMKNIPPAYVFVCRQKTQTGDGT